MSTTREKILDASLRLFARDGFETVSTSAIAGKLGMTKSALYKHFPDKRAIFDSLVDETLEGHREAVLSSGIARNPEEAAAQAYASATPKDMAALGEALFTHWTTNESAVLFRRMLSLERYRDERAAKVYDEFFVNGQLTYHRAMFTELIKIGALQDADAAQMALEFWSPIYLLMQATDGGMDIKKATALVRAHVIAFGEKYGRNNNG